MAWFLSWILFLFQRNSTISLRSTVHFWSINIRSWFLAHWYSWSGFLVDFDVSCIFFADWTWGCNKSKIETLMVCAIPLCITLVHISSKTSGLMSTFGFWSLWVICSLQFLFLVQVSDFLWVSFFFLEFITIWIFLWAVNISCFGLACFKFKHNIKSEVRVMKLIVEEGWRVEAGQLGAFRSGRHPEELDRAPRFDPREPDPIKRSGRLCNSHVSCAKRHLGWRPDALDRSFIIQQ